MFVQEDVSYACVYTYKMDYHEKEEYPQETHQNPAFRWLTSW